MKHPVLNAEARTVLGKQVKKLRREGLLPANVYGKGLSSKALQVKTSDFQAVFNKVGETGLVELTVEGKMHPVLIKNLQIDYSNNTPLHADFYQVNLKEKVKTMVPIEVAGEAKAVTEKIGILLQTLSEVEVEALPDRIPEKIEVNVEGLAEIDAALTVGDLKTEDGVTILTETGVTIVKISEPAKEEEPEPVAEEGAAAEGDEAKAEGGEKEGEKDKETKAEEKPQEKSEKK